MFRTRGLKVTPQRERIFRVLHGNGQHPSAEWVHAAAVRDMPTISLKTVYQTLNELARLGEIETMDLGTGSARFDPNTEPHHHLVCRSCGKVRDVYLDFDTRLPTDLHGFTVDSTEIVLRGLCDDCTRATESTVPSHDTGDTECPN